jgi:tRNA G18 (ribose-2'-O)-methylase SpoU
MTGGKSSLNVAVAFGIAIYHLRFGLSTTVAIHQ